MELTLHSVGVVHSAVSPSGRDVRWEEIESEIVIDHAWVDALDGLDAFSHIWVVFHLSQAQPPESLRTRPQGKADAPVVGRFATRSPVRPNPIGMTPVRLVVIKGNRLRVRGLDAFNGTPVLDLKPYLPQGDSLPYARVPDWVTRLQQTDDFIESASRR
jgi:tRNA-Thr(GGU) m(6)t(6)A37 methyltransferase TsaA